MSEELRELPEGWEWTTLGELCEIARGGSPRPIKQFLTNDPDGVNWIKISDASASSKYIYETKEKIKSDGIKYSRLVNEGDFILSNSMSFGRPYIMRTSGCIHDGWLVLKDKFGLFDQDYLYYFLGSNTTYKQFDQLAAGSTVKNLNIDLAKEVKVTLPPLNEQKRIVSKIEELNDRTQKTKEALEAIPQLCDRFRQSVLTAAFRGDLTADWREQNPDVEPASVLLERIRRDRRQRWEESELIKMQAKDKLPKDDNWKDRYQEPKKIYTSNLPELPDEWSWVRAEEVCDFITKGTTPSSNEMFEQAGDIPFIKVYNLTFDGKLDFSVNPTFINKVTHDSKLARSKVFPGDVLMNIVGPPLGKVSIVPHNQPEWNINQAIVVYRPIKGIYNRFLCYYLLSTECLFFATSMAKATAGQFNLTLEICRDLPLPIPPILEQEKIVAQIDNFFNIADIISQQVEEAKFKQEKLNQSILAKAFRGELVPQDPDDEPASVLLEQIRAEREKLNNSKPKSKRTSNRKSKTPEGQVSIPGLE
jgi:type I restriction enzyme, S subunit